MSLDISSGVLKIMQGPRLVLTTDGRLIRLLTDDLTFSQMVTFPDWLNKDIGYRWDVSTLLVSLNMDGSETYSRSNSCRSFLTVPPQEREIATILQAAPPGADVFFGRVRLTRQNTQSTWYGKAVDCLVKQGQWMPWFGSAVVEQDKGFARAIHFCIGADNNLTLTLEQSATTQPEGWGTFGHTGTGAGTGYQITFHTRKGFPVFVLDTNSDSSSQTISSGIITPLTNSKEGFAKGCSVVDVTNFASTYLFEAEGRFGRVIA